MEYIHYDLFAGFLMLKGTSAEFSSSCKLADFATEWTGPIRGTGHRIL
jgi:hypothetical protein